MGAKVPDSRENYMRRRAEREAREHDLRVAERFRDSHRKVAAYLTRQGHYQRAAAEADRAAHYARRAEQIKARRVTG